MLCPFCFRAINGDWCRSGASERRISAGPRQARGFAGTAQSRGSNSSEPGRERKQTVRGLRFTTGPLTWQELRVEEPPRPGLQGQHPTLMLGYAQYGRSTGRGLTTGDEHLVDRQVAASCGVGTAGVTALPPKQKPHLRPSAGKFREFRRAVTCRLVKDWAQRDLNSRPHPYQGCALAT